MRGKMLEPVRKASGKWQVSFDLLDDPRKDYERLQAIPDLTIEAKPYRRKRSLDANAYCWKLCTDIADALGITKEEVYRQNIRQGGAYTPLPIKADTVEAFEQIWSHNGIGWFVDVVDDSKLPGYKLVFAYHGSSAYDTKQMSSLIDRIVQDAASIGIETATPDEIARMKGLWADEKAVDAAS